MATMSLPPAPSCISASKTWETGLRLLPIDVMPETRLLLWGRGLRAFADGFVSLLLPAYLTLLGFSPLEIGVCSRPRPCWARRRSRSGVGCRAHRFDRAAC